MWIETIWIYCRMQRLFRTEPGNYSGSDVGVHSPTIQWVSSIFCSPGAGGQGILHVFSCCTRVCMAQLKNLNAIQHIVPLAVVACRCDDRWLNVHTKVNTLLMQSQQVVWRPDRFVSWLVLMGCVCMWRRTSEKGAAIGFWLLIKNAKFIPCELIFERW